VHSLQTHNLRKLLCLGAHSDDVEIGAGGTVLHLLRQHPELEVCWVVFTAAGARQDEAVASAEMFLSAARSKQIITYDFRDGFLPFVGEAVKERFEQLKQIFQPDLILTHFRDDAHQDHRLISQLTWNTYRNHPIWEYEIPKWDGDIGRPNLFVPLEEQDVSNKIEYLHRCFATQRSKHWFEEELFRSLLRLRGIESNTRYAEAFHARKLVVN